MAASRPAISRPKYAMLSRLGELLAKRLPHLFQMESGEAYLALCRALKDAISEAFGGSLENLFILETYRHMLPKYAEFEPWHHAEREKAKGATELVDSCVCGDGPTVHAPVGKSRERVGRCLSCENCAGYQPGKPRAVPALQSLIYGETSDGGGA